MNGHHFDDLVRSLSASRRSLLSGGSALAAGWLGVFDAAAKNRRKKKSQKNAFGCVDVGKACQGKNGKCCSGICQGKKPKKGQKDRSRCVAHNAGICTADTDTCTVGVNVPCHPSNPSCFCALTTGNAGFCGAFSGGTAGHCRICRKDSDCHAEFGAGAACLLLGGVCTPLCATTGRTACAPPCA